MQRNSQKSYTRLALYVICRQSKISGAKTKQKQTAYRVEIPVIPYRTKQKELLQQDKRQYTAYWHYICDIRERTAPAAAATIIILIILILIIIIISIIRNTDVRRIRLAVIYTIIFQLHRTHSDSNVVCLSCLLVILVSPAKTAEPINMPFHLGRRLGWAQWIMY